MTSQVEVPPLTGLIHFFSGKRRVKLQKPTIFRHIALFKQKSDVDVALIFSCVHFLYCP